MAAVTETPQTESANKEIINVSHPYFISSSDTPGMQLVNTPFDGKSFPGWKRGMLIAFAAKNKAGFIDGSSSKPSGNTDLETAWTRANSMVIAWILNSLSREISESVIYFTTAKDIWNDLEARFGQSSGAKLFQLQKELSDLTQGASDIATYYTKMKRLWDELESLDTFICTCACTCEARSKMLKAKQDEKLVKFLMGLNDMYCGARGNILMISPLPSVANAYALLMQEEKQREMNLTPKFPGDASSFVVAGQGGDKPFYPEGKGQKGQFYNKKITPTCKYCKKLGHTVEQCYRLKGFPPNFKFTKPRTNPNFSHANAAYKQEGNGEQFFYNTEYGEAGKQLSQEQLQQIAKMLSELKATDPNKEHANDSNANCAGPFNEEPHGPW